MFDVLEPDLSFLARLKTRDLAVEGLHPQWPSAP